MGDLMSDIKSYDELIKLKELLDMGIITEDEFSAKKRQILGIDISESNDNKSDKQEETSMNLELISCPGCGRKVSRMAEACPGCGYPIEDYIYDLEIEEEEQKQKELIEKRKKSDEYKLLNKIDSFVINDYQFNVSQNCVISSEIVDEFDETFKGIVNTMRGYVPFEKSIYLTDNEHEIDFSSKIRKFTFSNLFDLTSRICKRYLNLNEETESDDVAERIFEESIDEETFEKIIFEKYLMTKEAVDNALGKKIQRAQDAEIAMNNWHSSIDSVYGNGIIGLFAANLAAETVDFISASAHVLSNKKEYIDSHKGLDELISRVYHDAYVIYSKFVEGLIFESCERIIQGIITELSKACVVNEGYTYAPMTYETYSTCIDTIYDLRDKRVVDDDLVKKCIFKLVERNYYEVDNYICIALFSDLSKSDVENLLKLLSYLGKEEEFKEAFNSEGVIYTPDEELEEESATENEQKLRKRKEFCTILEKKICLFESTEIGKLEKLRSVLREELQVTNQFNQRIELKGYANEFRTRFQTICKYASIPTVDLHYGNREKMSETNRKAFENIQIYSAGTELTEHILWARYDKRIETWYVMTDEKIIVGDNYIFWKDINETCLFIPEKRKNDINPNKSNMFCGILLIMLKKDVNVEIESDNENIIKKDNRVVIFIDYDKLMDEDERLWLAASIANEKYKEPEYKYKCSYNTAYCPRCLDVADNRLKCKNCGAILFWENAALSDYAFKYDCRKRWYYELPDLKIDLSEEEKKSISPFNFMGTFDNPKTKERIHFDWVNAQGNAKGFWDDKTWAWRSFIPSDNFISDNGLRIGTPYLDLVDCNGEGVKKVFCGKTDTLYSLLTRKDDDVDALDEAKTLLEAKYSVEYCFERDKNEYRVRYYFDSSNKVYSIAFFTNVMFKGEVIPEEKVECPKCKNKINISSKFCNFCGEKMVGAPISNSLVVCPKCGKAISESAKFCSFCGDSIVKSPGQSQNGAYMIDMNGYGSEW